MTAPTGTTGQVRVPLLTASATSTAPAGATFLRRDGSYDVYAVGAGTYEFNSAP